MQAYLQSTIEDGVGILTLDRPKALNSLSLDMVRSLSHTLLSWREDPRVGCVLIRSSSAKAFCAGGDIRFFHVAGHATPMGGSALLEDFFTEEYALNHLIHSYPKPYIALMDGVVMGGGMGISQGGPDTRLRIVTELTKMAMPEVNIGLFPDVGGSHFLTRCPGQLGTWLGLTGNTIGAADAIHAGLADVFLPSSELAQLLPLLSQHQPDPRAAILAYAAPFQEQLADGPQMLASQRARIDQHFGYDSVAQVLQSLQSDADPFAQTSLLAMQKRSPLMMCVTLAQLRRGAQLNLADCLRMERNMVRRCFEHGEVLEGVRAMVIDKDNAPQWSPATLEQVSVSLVEGFFSSPWPDWAHPLRHLA